MILYVLESGEFFQYTPVNVSKMGTAGEYQTVCKLNRKRNEDSRCRMDATWMRLPGATLYGEVFFSYVLDCTGWAGDPVPVGSEEHISLKRERVDPDPQGMGGVKGIPQGDAEEKCLLPPPSERQPCEILKTPLKSYF